MNMFPNLGKELFPVRVFSEGSLFLGDDFNPEKYESTK